MKPRQLRLGIALIIHTLIFHWTPKLRYNFTNMSNKSQQRPITMRQSRFEFFHEQLYVCAFAHVANQTKLYVYKKHFTTCSKSLMLCQFLISVCCACFRSR